MGRTGRNTFYARGWTFDADLPRRPRWEGLCGRRIRSPHAWGHPLRLWVPPDLSPPAGWGGSGRFLFGWCRGDVYSGVATGSFTV